MFEQYKKKISELTSFNKDDILNANFRLDIDGKIEIYYAPHNEIINKQAKVLIVGITPGWTQTSIAYKVASTGLKSNLSIEEIKLNCKRSARFVGSMRNNLITMLDEIKLNEKLNIPSCNKLFEEDELLHTTSLIPYPTFINKKNYTGSNPKIMDNKLLYSYVKKYFYKEVSTLENVLIIPLGKSVEEVLAVMIENNLISKKQCLLGFPHPSGANGHRLKQLKENKANLIKIIEEYFS